MVYGAIDLHLRYSQVRIIDDAGCVQRDQRVVTTRERLVQAFDGHGSMRILLETGTESEWVAQALEAAVGEHVTLTPWMEPGVPPDALESMFTPGVGGGKCGEGAAGDGDA